MKKITVIGLGYVGLSMATLLSTKHEVIAYDITKEKVDKLNEKISPIKDEYISKYLESYDLNMRATSDVDDAVKNSDFYIIATPTDYNEHTQHFDTSSIENCLDIISSKHSDAKVVIKSTIPIFFMNEIVKRYPNLSLFFSPEFLREGQALYDNLYPSRIIVSPKSEDSLVFGELLKECSLKEDVEILSMNYTEAEAVKLFSNTYLALRVSYFNELDTFAETYGLESGDIIRGVSLDPRIGDYYNNPSFGYGGYCLPKDTKQLKANFNGIQNSIISAVVSSNTDRKVHIANQIMKSKPKTVGVYKLAMKANSDNYRASSIIDVMNILDENNIEVIIYDELLTNMKFFKNFPVLEDFKEFVETSDIIITNRLFDELKDFSSKVYTRDLFGGN